jgi:TolB-like protein/Tfp pilus assembly protein PilF
MSEAASAGDRLDSWKEIASYLGREVRTAQGWEKTEGLPVHRHRHARQGSVYAFRSELDAWQRARQGHPEPPPQAAPLRRSRWSGALLIAGSVVLSVLVVSILASHHPLTHAEGGTPSSIVVLPFLDLSPQKDQEYFSDGLTEEIIDALSRVPDLRVVARTTAFAFKGKPADIRQIGRQLNVGAVLEGSVRKSGDELRITAQLNRVVDGYHLWSRTYDRHLRDVFAVQSEISQAISDQLRAGPIPHRERTENLEAYRLYQEGRYLFNQFQPPDSDYKAIERYRRAIRLDPNFAAAYAGVADAYAYLAENFVVAPREVMPKALIAAERAVALDDSSAEAHTSLGIVKLDYDRDREGAEREFLRAMRLNPGSGYTHHWYAHSLEAQGRLPEAMREMRAALDLDPLDIPINWDVASELLWSGRYEEALQLARKAGDLFPSVSVFQYMETEAEYGKADWQAAHSTVEKLRKKSPELAADPVFMSMFGVDAARQGRRAEATAILDRLETLRLKQYVEPFLAIELCSALKDDGRLRLWLQRADQERSSMFVYLPMYRDLWAFESKALAQIADRR